ncbi:Secologanin synthase [Apostasia shenzhenica]|uniref:Secologanin synthase n=1 Tax=Apostasia shenzhenica TaxID=1088818 RepID=A0A2I0B097_9ASPA|nr:Secologanin synthase [Apostasia shenzhenica]
MADGLLLRWGWWCAAAAVAVAFSFWRAAEWLWLRPRRLERALKGQGLQGSRYRFPFGDLKEDVQLIREASRTPIPLSHRIVPRVAPDLQRRLELYGGKNKMPYGWFGTYPRVIIMDQEVVREALSNKSGHVEKPRASSVEKLLISGIGSHIGEKWAERRRIINPAFQAERLKRMMPVFSSCCDELISEWENLIGNSGTYELNVWPEFQRFTSNVISQAAFGSSYKEGQRIFELQREQAQLVIENAQNLSIPLFRFIPTQTNRRRNEIQREVVALLKSMIEKRDRAIRNGEVIHDDYLGLLMDSNSRHSEEKRDNLRHIKLSEDDIVDECKLLYFAGHETITVLLTWTMILLSIHRSWQEQAREEVLQVFGQNKPDSDGLNRLKIVTMILHEVLRLYPPAIVLARQIYKELKLGEITFPPGVQLLLPIIFIHHSKEFWGEDAEEFNPERFAAGISKATKNQLIFFPFGWGPRICIGQSFSLIEAKMVLAKILQCFSIELSPAYAHAPITLLTLQPQYGAQVILHKI